MIYENILPARFVSRPNRFIAHILVDGTPQIAHVKNTGRCRELLIPGAEIFVQHCPAASRKTAYDLITVRKGGRLVNMDSTAPNRLFAEWARAGGVPDLTLLRPEVRRGSSRFDFYLEAAGRPTFVEVKGVTLEEDGIVRFPDAPTERGVRHLRELADCVRQGLDAWAVFIVQMSGVRHLEPNRKTHPEFADALADAHAAGVRLLALDCLVTEDTVTANAPVEIRLEDTSLP